MSGERVIREVVHFVRAWRKFRGLSTIRVASDAGVTASLISQLETGKTAYSQDTLEAVAKALDTEPWRLLYGPPDKALGFSDRLASIEAKLDRLLVEDQPS